MKLTFDQENSKPLVEEYLKEHPKQNGNRFPIRSAYAAKSGKGFILEVKEFRCFLWKSNQVANYLFEALEIYAAHNVAPVIEIVLDKETKGQFYVDISESEDTVPITQHSKHNFSLGKEEESTTLTTLNENPFLSKFKPVPLTPSQVSTGVEKAVKGGTGTVRKT